jgi:hypothetical protein
MNSTIKTAAKVVEELNQSNENSDMQRRHSTHKRLRKSLKKWGRKVMHGQYIRSTDSLLVKKACSYGCRGEI